jgi:hypothetical protein
MSGPKTLKWKDVLKTLKSFTPEQLELPAVIMDMNNEDRDNCLIADPYDMFVNDIPALFFHSGYGWEFDRNPYYRNEFKE